MTSNKTSQKLYNDDYTTGGRELQNVKQSQIILTFRDVCQSFASLYTRGYEVSHNKRHLRTLSEETLENLMIN